MLKLGIERKKETNPARWRAVRAPRGARRRKGNGIVEIKFTKCDPNAGWPRRVAGPSVHAREMNEVSMNSKEEKTNENNIK